MDNAIGSLMVAAHRLSLVQREIGLAADLDKMGSLNLLALTQEATAAWEQYAAALAAIARESS